MKHEQGKKMDFEETISMARRRASQDELDIEAMHTFMYLAPALMCVKCYDDQFSAGRYVFVSREWERTFSIKKIMVLGKTDYELFPRQDADKARIDDIHTLEFGTATTLSDGGGTRYSGWKPIKMALIPMKIGGDRFNYIARMALSTTSVAYDV